jgi:hypothetical protein
MTERCNNDLQKVKVKRLRQKAHSREEWASVAKEAKVKSSRKPKSN